MKYSKKYVVKYGYIDLQMTDIQQNISMVKCRYID